MTDKWYNEGGYLHPANNWKEALEKVNMGQEINLYNGKGYVKLIDHLGNDLSFVRAARASYAKDSTVWNEREEKLLNFLIREQHFSVFRHAAVTYQVKAPLFVARQHFKYQVASTHIDDQNGWNEMSKRYVTANNEYYIPTQAQWREAPVNSKQGSGLPADQRIGKHMSSLLEEYVTQGEKLYNDALGFGIAPEQARLFLPAYGLMVNYQWTVSVANLIHFLQERLAHDAQAEITEMASAIRDLTLPLYPATFKAFGLENK
jgi:thymidylate synthase (FAD)